jgi:hypothetical protein
VTFRSFLRLFADRYLGRSFRAWRSLGDVAIDHVEPEDRSLISEITGGRTAFPSTLWRFILLIGRRGGKSLFTALVAAYLAVFRRPSTMQPGEVLRVIIIAPGRAQCRVVLGYIKGLFTAVPQLAALIESETAESVTLNNGVVIEVSTASFRHVRGYSYLAVIIDEACFLRDEMTAANPLGELLTAIEPGLATVPGAMLFMISTVYARTGPVYEMAREGFGVNDPETLVVRAATRTMNETIPQSIIDRAMARDPSAARAEWLSIERDDVEAFLPRAAIDAVVQPGRFELPRVAGISYVGGLDMAGGSGSDSAVGAVAHTETRDGIEIAVLDALLEIRPPFSPSDACAQIAALFKRYGICSAISDRWGGQFPIEEMRKHSIVVTPSAKPKSDLYLELGPNILSRRVELLDHPRLIAQLAALERRTGRGGRDTVDHPATAHAHDDVSNGAALVLVLDSTARGGGLRVRALANSIQEGSDLRAAYARSLAAASRYNPFR